MKNQILHSRGILFFIHMYIRCNRIIHTYGQENFTFWGSFREMVFDKGTVNKWYANCDTVRCQKMPNFWNIPGLDDDICEYQLLLIFILLRVFDAYNFTSITITLKKKLFFDEEFIIYNVVMRIWSNYPNDINRNFCYCLYVNDNFFYVLSE